MRPALHAGNVDKTATRCEALHHVEELLQETPEVESYSRRTGLELGLFVTEPNRGDFAVKLKNGHKRPTEEVEAELRERE